jgi:hypothetical protein
MVRSGGPARRREPRTGRGPRAIVTPGISRGSRREIPESREECRNRVRERTNDIRNLGPTPHPGFGALAHAISTFLARFRNFSARFHLAPSHRVANIRPWGRRLTQGRPRASPPPGDARRGRGAPPRRAGPRPSTAATTGSTPTGRSWGRPPACWRRAGRCWSRSACASAPTTSGTWGRRLTQGRPRASPPPGDARRGRGARDFDIPRAIPEFLGAIPLGAVPSCR